MTRGKRESEPAATLLPIRSVSRGAVATAHYAHLVRRVTDTVNGTRETSFSMLPPFCDRCFQRRADPYLRTATHLIDRHMHVGHPFCSRLMSPHAAGRDEISFQDLAAPDPRGGGEILIPMSEIGLNHSHRITLHFSRKGDRESLSLRHENDG